MGKNLCHLYIRQGTDNQHIQGAQKLSFKKITDSMKKRAYHLNRVFSKEEVQIDKKHIKMLTILGHTGNKNQNSIKIQPHSC
jgi:hypothetical protein